MKAETQGSQETLNKKTFPRENTAPNIRNQSSYLSNSDIDRLEKRDIPNYNPTMPSISWDMPQASSKPKIIRTSTQNQKTSPPPISRAEKFLKLKFKELNAKVMLENQQKNPFLHPQMEHENHSSMMNKLIRLFNRREIGGVEDDLGAGFIGGKLKHMRITGKSVDEQSKAYKMKLLQASFKYDNNLAFVDTRENRRIYSKQDSIKHKRVSYLLR